MADDRHRTEHEGARVVSPPERSPKLEPLDALIGEWVVGDPVRTAWKSLLLLA